MSLLNGILLAVAALIIGVIISTSQCAAGMPVVWNKN